MHRTGGTGGAGRADRGRGGLDAEDWMWLVRTRYSMFNTLARITLVRMQTKVKDKYHLKHSSVFGAKLPLLFDQVKQAVDKVIQREGQLHNRSGFYI